MDLARIAQIASHFRLRRGSILDREDLIQEGALADLKGRAVRWGVVDAIRQSEGRLDHSNGRYFRETLPNLDIEARSGTELEELQEAVHVAIQSLPEPGRKIFEGRLRGRTLKAIGESCHRTESWACRELMLHTPGLRLLLERALGID